MVNTRDGCLERMNRGKYVGVSGLSGVVKPEKNRNLSHLRMSKS